MRGKTTGTGNTYWQKTVVLTLMMLLIIAACPGARAYSYSVDISSYDAFRNATYGREFDIDGQYGAQCWDGAALLWQQLGRGLDTGGGNARGTWLNCRDQNAGSDFDLIYGIENVKRGDVVVFDYNRNFNALDENGIPCGHIAFADNDYTPGVGFNVYGQNQVDSMAFSLQYDVSTENFLGAFRLKRWSGAPVTGTLDVNGILDGIRFDSLGAYGTVDVYIDNELVADDVSDFYGSYPVGTRYWITDIKARTGFIYMDFSSDLNAADLLGGTITSRGISMRFEFITSASSSLPLSFKASIVTMDGKYVARPVDSSIVSWDVPFVRDAEAEREIRRDWFFEAQSDGTYKITPVGMEDYVLSGDYGAIELKQPNNTLQAQTFILQERDGHYCMIGSLHKSYCLTVTQSGEASVLKGSTVAYTDNQLFDLEMHNNDILPEGFYVSPTRTQIMPGRSMKMEVTILPFHATEAMKTYTWEVSERNFVSDGASVSQSGYLTVRKPGLYYVRVTPVAGYGIARSALVIAPSFPASMKTIEEEACAGTSLNYVIIPDGCETIGSRAFADNTKLANVFIPASVTSIATDAFSGCNRNLLTILGYSDTEANSFATANGFFFSSLGSYP